MISSLSLIVAICYYLLPIHSSLSIDLFAADPKPHFLNLAPSMHSTVVMCIRSVLCDAARVPVDK